MPDHSTRLPASWLDWLINALAWIAGLLMCALTVMICADVLARYFRLFAMPWSLDVSEYALLLITFFGAPWVLLRRSHVSIDIFVRALKPRHQASVTRLSYAIGVLVCGGLLIYSIKTWWRSFTQGTLVHETFVFPEWWLFVVPPPIFLILMAIFIRWLRTPTPGVAPSADGT